MLLSIIVNMYNSAKFLPKCMKSLLSQDIDAKQYEIVLVNDGSTDNSLELAMEYYKKSKQENYPTIKIINQKNKGLAGARNSGLDAAVGKYMCFVDPDDYIEDKSLSFLLDKMEKSNLDVLRFNYQKVDEQYNLIPDGNHEITFDYSESVVSGEYFLADRLGVTCYVWAYIFRTEIIKYNCIYFIEGSYFDDTPWLPRVLCASKRVSCVDVKHVYYMQRNGSLVHTIDKISALKKVDGQIKLIEELQCQMSTLFNSSILWYRSIITHVVVSILAAISVYDFMKSRVYICKLKSLGVLPLTPTKFHVKKDFKKKVILINISPFLFCLVVKIKSLLKRC